MTRILGIDPGSRYTGYGIVEHAGNKVSFLHCGTLRLGSAEIPERLGAIYSGLAGVIAQWQPDEVSVEKVFMARNPDSALKLGQARGAAIVAAALQDIPVFEYAARSVKQAVTGKGSADKTQVQHMVKHLLKLPGTPQADAADALAIAITHAHANQNLLASAGVRGVRRSRLRM